MSRCRQEKIGDSQEETEGERVIERERERERENNSKPDNCYGRLMCIIQFIPHDNIGNQMIANQASEA